MSVTKISIALLFFFTCVNTAWSQPDRPSEETIKQSVRDLIKKALWYDYDIEKIQIETVEEYHDTLRTLFKEDYGLVKVIVSFTSKRNENKSTYTRDDGKISSLNLELYKNDALCSTLNHLYLHCGVKKGYIFEGKLKILMAPTSRGWEILDPQWRTLTSIPLQGYLILDGKQKEGYVWFPKKEK